MLSCRACPTTSAAQTLAKLPDQDLDCDKPQTRGMALDPSVAVLLRCCINCSELIFRWWLVASELRRSWSVDRDICKHARTRLGKAIPYRSFEAHLVSYPFHAT